MFVLIYVFSFRESYLDFIEVAQVSLLWVLSYWKHEEKNDFEFVQLF